MWRNNKNGMNQNCKVLMLFNTYWLTTQEFFKISILKLSDRNYGDLITAIFAVISGH